MQSLAWILVSVKVILLFCVKVGREWTRFPVLKTRLFRKKRHVENLFDASGLPCVNFFSDRT